MSNETAQAYREATDTFGSLHQRFLYGFGGQIEILMTLLEKEHWQAAGDIMPLIQREKVNFEALLLELMTSYTAKMVKCGSISTEEAFDEPGSDPGEASDS